MTLQNVKIQLRADDLSNWISADPILRDNEFVIVNDVENGIERFKIGNGISSFTQLPYVNQHKIITNTVVQGPNNNASQYSFASGIFLSAVANFSQALGINAHAKQSDDYSFVWNGDSTRILGDFYETHGQGTFNINPAGGLSGVYIGEQTLAETLTENAGSKVYFDNRISGITGSNDLSIIKISSDEYGQILDDVLSNAIYIVEDSYNNAFGAQMKNLAPGTDLSDAVNVEQLSSALSTKAELSIVEEVENSIYSIYSILSSKQDILSEEQMQAISSVVDERQTVVEYADGTVQSYNIVGNIEDDSISNHLSVVRVDIGTGVSAMLTAVFMGCENLTCVTIPDSVVDIGYYNFNNTPKLSSLTLPNNISSIKSQCFDNSSISSLTIPSSVVEIEEDGFATIPLTSLIFKGKTLSEVQAMYAYPWGLSNTSIIQAFDYKNVLDRLSALESQLSGLEDILHEINTGSQS